MPLSPYLPVPIGSPNNTAQRTTTTRVKASKIKTPKTPKVKATKVKTPKVKAPTPLSAQPITPGSQVTNAQLGQLTTVDVQQKYGYVDQDLKNQYAQSRANESAVPGYYQNYQDQLKQITADQKVASQAAVDQITGLGGTLAAAAGRSAVADQSQMAADAAIRGVNIDPAALTAATNAAAVNTGNIGTQAALQIGLGNNANTFFGGQAVVGAQAKLAALAKVISDRTKIDSSSAVNAQNKGNEATSFGNTYKNAETTRLQNQQVIDNTLSNNTIKNQQAAASAQQTADSKAATLAEQGRRDRSNARAKKASTAATVSAANARTTAAANKPYKYGYSVGEWQALSLPQRTKIAAANKGGATTTKDAYGNTPKQTRAANDSFSRAKALGSILQGGGKKADGTVIPGASQTEIYQGLLGENVSEPIARAVSQQLAQGYVDPSLGRSLKRRGVTSGYSTKNPTKTAAGQQPHT